MAEKKRDLNLDLIRSFALVAVLGMHYYDNSGFYNTVIDRPGDFVMAMVRMLCATCVPLFIMLTGWLCSGKKLSARYYIGILRIIELYVLSTLACIIFEALYLDSSLSLKYIVSGLINFELNGYAWYLLLYGGLFLMMPFLNMMYAGCATKGRKLLLTGTFFALSILPSLLNSYAHIYPLWWSKLYPICYYFTGAYLREYSKKISSLKYGLLLLSLLLLFCSYTQLRFHGSPVDFQAVFYDHYQVYVLTVLVFLFLGSLNMDKARSWLKTSIYKVANLSLSAYLLSWISDGIIYREFVPFFPRPEDRFIWILVLVPLSLVSSLIMAQIIQWVYLPIDFFCVPSCCSCCSIWNHRITIQTKPRPRRIFGGALVYI